MASQKLKKGKRARRRSSDEFYVEEISADDMGYDGDSEVLRPDQYEEAESDFEDDKALKRLWPDTDDELAGKLRRLSCLRNSVSSPRREDSDRGRKRRSKEMDTDDPNSRAPRTEIEISELIDGHTEQPPMKKRKKKANKPPGAMAHRVLKRHSLETWSDSSDKTDEQEATIESSRSGTPDLASTPTAVDGDGRDGVGVGGSSSRQDGGMTDAMDIG